MAAKGGAGMSLFKKEPKQEKKAKTKKREVKKEYFEESKPLTYKAITYFKYMFWLVVAAILVYGVFTATNPVRPKIYREEYKQAVCEGDTAKAYAEQFVREYLTYKVMDQDYKSRITKLAPNMVSDETRRGWSTVIETSVFNTKKLNDKFSVITVYAKVKQGDTERDPGKIKALYVKVPIAALDQDRVYVRDYPVFVAAPNDARPENYTYKGKEVVDTVREEIKSTLHNFFKIYDVGTPEQISYFLKDKKKVKGYEGNFKYDSIQSIQAYQLNGKDTEAFVVAEIMVKDEHDTTFRQTFNFKMEKDTIDGKSAWYIKEFVDVGQEY